MKKYLFLSLFILGITAITRAEELDLPEDKQKRLEEFFIREYPLPESFTLSDVDNNKEIDFPDYGKFTIENINIAYGTGKPTTAQVTFVQPVHVCGLNIANYRMYYRYKTTDPIPEVVPPSWQTEKMTIATTALKTVVGCIAVGVTCDLAIKLQDKLRELLKQI